MIIKEKELKTTIDEKEKMIKREREEKIKLIEKLKIINSQIKQTEYNLNNETNNINATIIKLKKEKKNLNNY